MKHSEWYSLGIGKDTHNLTANDIHAVRNATLVDNVLGVDIEDELGDLRTLRISYETPKSSGFGQTNYRYVREITFVKLINENGTEDGDTTKGTGRLLYLKTQNNSETLVLRIKQGATNSRGFSLNSRRLFHLLGGRSIDISEWIYAEDSFPKMDGYTDEYETSDGLIPEVGEDNVISTVFNLPVSDLEIKEKKHNKRDIQIVKHLNVSELPEYRAIKDTTVLIDGKGIYSVKDAADHGSPDGLLVIASSNPSLVYVSMPNDRIDTLEDRSVYNYTTEEVDNTYVKNTLKSVEGWLTISNKNTNEQPNVSPIGDDRYLYEGLDPTSQYSAKQLIFGTRYSAQSSVYLTGYRVYTVAGNNYVIYSVEDPNGLKAINQIVSFSANTSGWQEFGLSPSIIRENTDFDIVVVASEPDPTPTTFTGDWDYGTPNNPSPPSSGSVIHSNNSRDVISINYVDNAGSDRSAELQSLTIGDVVEVEGVRWALQATDDQGSYIDFSVAPATQLSSDSVKSFTFETTTATPITILEDVNYNQSAGNISGLFTQDDSYDNITVNDNAYGVDIKVQEAYIPKDWDFLAFTGNLSGASSSSLGILSSETAQIRRELDDIESITSYGVTSQGLIPHDTTESTETVINFGSATSNFVNIVDGVVEVLEETVETRCNAEIHWDRSGGGVSQLAVWMEASFDGGVSYDIVGSSLRRQEIPNNGEGVSVYDFSIVYPMPAGLKYKFVATQVGAGILTMQAPNDLVTSKGTVTGYPCKLSILKVR